MGTRVSHTVSTAPPGSMRVRGTSRSRSILCRVWFTPAEENSLENSPSTVPTVMAWTFMVGPSPQIRSKSSRLPRGIWIWDTSTPFKASRTTPISSALSRFRAAASVVTAAISPASSR